jgi:translocator protein
MSRILITILICLLSAAIEGVLAGRGVKQRFAELRFPRYSFPIPLWYVIGVLYYTICFVLLYRLLGLDNLSNAGWNGACILLLVMMTANAGWNYFFFRARSLLASLVVSGIYTIIAVVLFFCLFSIDRIGAWVLLPYVLYLGYANMWGYRLWKLNR